MRVLYILSLRISTVGLLATVAAGLCTAGVTVSESTINFKTWSEGLPDINPWFELYPSDNFAMYPYTLRNNFLSDTSIVTWRQLVLENEYLYCRVFAAAASLFDSLSPNANALVRAAGLEVAVLRHEGNAAAAASLHSQSRAASPTDLFLRYEGTLLNIPDSTILSDLGAEPERVLNLVDDYLRLGFYSDALAARV